MAFHMNHLMGIIWVSSICFALHSKFDEKAFRSCGAFVVLSLFLLNFIFCFYQNFNFPSFCLSIRANGDMPNWLMCLFKIHFVCKMSFRHVIAISNGINVMYSFIVATKFNKLTFNILATLAELVGTKIPNQINASILFLQTLFMWKKYMNLRCNCWLDNLRLEIRASNAKHFAIVWKSKISDSYSLNGVQNGITYTWLKHNWNGNRESLFLALKRML